MPCRMQCKQESRRSRACILCWVLPVCRASARSLDRRYDTQTNTHTHTHTHVGGHLKCKLLYSGCGEGPTSQVGLACLRFFPASAWPPPPPLGCMRGGMMVLTAACEEKESLHTTDYVTDYLLPTDCQAKKLKKTVETKLLRNERTNPRTNVRESSPPGTLANGLDGHY